MRNELFPSRAIRARLACSPERRVLIYRENPIIEYFTDDSRTEAILLEDGLIKLLGSVEIDDQFQERNDLGNTCCISPYYNQRNARNCDITTDDLFPYPTNNEMKFIKRRTEKLRSLVLEEVQSISNDVSEYSMAERIRGKLCEMGYLLSYNPIVAFDANTAKLWNKASGVLPKKVMYFEVSVRESGLSITTSNTVLFSQDEDVLNHYRTILEAVEKLKMIYIEGNDLSIVSGYFEKFRNKKIYLNTPLFPFRSTPIPGDNSRIRVGDVTVFDLWECGNDYCIRKKVIAVAGSYSATII